MLDQRLRQLEREVRQNPGDLALRQAWLSERNRLRAPCAKCRGEGRRHSEILCEDCCGSGNDFSWKLELAAWCGDATAQALLALYTESDHIEGICPCRDCFLDSRADREGWFLELSRWGRESMARALLAWVEKRGPHYALRGANPGFSRAQALILRSAKAFLDAASDENRELLGTAARTFLYEGEAQTIAAAAGFVVLGIRGDLVGDGEFANDVDRAMHLLSRRMSVEEAKAVEETLIHWALGA